MKKYLLIFIVTLIYQLSFSQSFSNKGKDFWISYPEHIDGNTSAMGIYITSDVNATGTITVNGTVIPFTLVANNVVRKFIGPGAGGDAPNTFVHLGSLQDGIKIGGAIHVVSDKSVAVYAHIIKSARSGATLVLPTNVWGREYIAPSYANSGASTGYGEINVMAKVANTIVEITPAKNSRNGSRLAGVPFQITLANPGDVYQLQFGSALDLTGTRIKSINCQPIAVFSATTWTGMNCNNASGGDNFYQQLFPISTWGKTFLTAPFKNRTTDIVRVIVNNPGTIVQKTELGITTTLTGLVTPAPGTAGYYEFSTGNPTQIVADSAISCVQYVTSQSCKAGCSQASTNVTCFADPEMVILNPIEQTINDITVFSAHQNWVPSGQSNVTQCFLNIIIKTAAASSFTLNGVQVSLTTPFTVIAGTQYSYLQYSITNAATNPVQTLHADSSFTAIAYGFGTVESYGYNAGTNVRDLNKDIELINQYSTINQASACSNSPFKFKIFIPNTAFNNITGLIDTIRYDSMKWQVTNPNSFSPNNFPLTVLGNTLYPPQVGLKVAPDSVNIRNGKSVAWYSLPTNYAVNLTGNFTLNVTGFGTTNNSDGCSTGNETDYEFNFIIAPPPTSDFSFAATGCPSEPVQFTETTIQTPYPTYHFWWDFGDGTPVVTGNSSSPTSPLRNPVHTYASPGTYTVRFSNITTPGCISDTVPHQVVIPKLVNASINGSNTICQNDGDQAIAFTGTDGVQPYTFTYIPTINGVTGAAQTIVSTGTSATLIVPSTTAGTFNYNFVKVENANPAYCSRVLNQTATVIVKPLPTATISGTSTVCQNATSPIVTFTGSNATAPYKFTYTLNGVTQPVVTSNAAGVYTITVPTTAALNNVYQLVSVQDASTTLCSQTITGQTATVIVQQNPTATIATTSTAVCQSGTAPTVTFTASGGVAPYNFTYTLTANGVASAPVTVNSLTNTYTITVPLTTAGTFVYALNSVENLTPISCVTPLNLSVTIQINPVPTASISGSTSVCQVAGAQTIIFTGANGTPPYQFFYNINGGPTLNVTSTGNTATVTAPVTTVGDYMYNLLSVQELGTSTQCSQTQTGTATVVVQATSTATITGNTTVCQDAPSPNITFTAANGVAPFTFIYTVTTNGVVGPQQIATTAAGSFTATVPVPMTTVGTLVYTLISVQNTGGQTCITPINGQTATVVINPVPTATIAGTTTICQNSTPPQVTFNGFGATGNTYVFNYTINGVAQTPLIGNNLTVNQPTGTPNVYTYIITSVKDNATGCTKTYAAATAPTAVVTIKELATATVVTSAATVCQNSTAPTITFTATGGQAPYKFAYTITYNGVVGAPITTSYTPFGNSLTVTVPTATAGTYIYTLVNVEESANACVNAQSGSTLVIVHPQPTASYTTSPPYCAQNAVTITPSFGITPTGSVVSWVWDYGDGAGQQIRPNGNPFTLTYPTAGVKLVTFKTVSDKGCESVLYSTNVTINSKPKAGFKSPEACLADTYADFTDTSTVAGVGASIVNWEWDFGDGSPIYSGGTTGPASHQNPRHPYLAVGQKTVTLIVTSNSGCKDTITQSFFINGEVLSANFIPLNNPNFCSNRPVEIKENSVVAVGGLIRVDIYWDNATSPTVFYLDDFPTPNKIYSHSYPNLQVDRNYQIRYIAYSGFNGLCQKEIITTITVKASPVAVFAPIQNVCLNGGPIVLNTGTIGGSGIGTGVYLGNGVTVNNGVYSFDPLAAGVTVGNNNNVTYTVTSVASCDSSLVQPIKVLAPPVVNTFTTISNKCVNNAITFHQTYTNGDGTVVKWIYDWGDGTPVQTFTTGADQTHTYATIGIKTATLTLETGFGCRNIPFPVTFTVNPLPVPSYTFTNSVCLPNAVITFTNTTPSVGSNTYVWSFEYPSTTAANTSTQANLPTHQYMTQGPFSTHLVATNITTGCIDSSLIQIINSSTIHPAPVLQFNTIPDVCLNNGTVNIALASETSGIAGGPGIYTCVDVPAAITTAGIFNPLIAGEGVHTIKYSWTSTFNCTSTITKTVKVLIAPRVDTLYTVGNRCEQNQIVFSNTSTSIEGTVVKWVYNWGDGTTADTILNGNNVTHTYAAANTTVGYTATLMLITSDGCKSLPKALQVFVNPIPHPDFRYSDTTCLPLAKVIFTNTTANYNDWIYQWNFDFPSTNLADLSSSPTNVPYTYTTLSPQHSVKLVATSASTFCTNFIVKPVLSIHPAPVASFYFDKASICVNKQVGVIDGPSDFKDGAGKTWVWDYGDGTIGNGQTQGQHTYTTAQTFNVKLTVTNSFGCVDDTIRPFVVYPYPLIDAGRDTLILLGGQTVLTATATGNDLSYLWTGTPLPLNLSSTTVLNPIASPQEDITYALTVTARGGCALTDYVFVKVLKYPEIPNTFTPNNDGIHDTWVIKYLDSYPNCFVQVFTRTGQLVFESKGYKKPWDGNKGTKLLPFDTYYYIIEPGSGRKPLTGYVTIVK